MMGFLPLIPFYAEQIGVTGDGPLRIWSGVIVAAAPLPAALMGPIWGALGDRIGRKLMMLRANAAIVLFVGSMGFVTSPWQLLALRLGQGVFSGFIAPAMTLVSVSTPAERQGRTAAYLQTALMAGGIVGPLMGGAVADVWGHRAVFFVCSALSAVAMVLVSLFVVEPARETSAAASEAEADDIDAAPAALPAKAGSGVDGTGLLRAAIRDVADFLRHPVLRIVLAGAFAVRFGASLVDPILALWVETRTGFEMTHVATVTGFVFGAQAVATLLFTPVWGRLGDRLGNRKLLAICAAGAGLASLAQVMVDHVLVLTALRFVGGAFVAGVVPAAFSAAAHNSPVERRGAAQGVTFSVIVLARATAPLGGGVLAAVAGLGPLFVVSAVLMLLTAGAALRSSQREPPKPPKPA